MPRGTTPPIGTIDTTIGIVRVYLTRRSLLALLSKLDRTKAGDPSLCTIIKEDRVHPLFPCSHVTVITAVEDEDYYIDRKPGAMHHKDGG